MKHKLYHIFFCVFFFSTTSYAVEGSGSHTATTTFPHDDIINEIITVNRPRLTRIQEKPATISMPEKKIAFITKETPQSLRFAFGVSRDIFLKKWFPITAFHYQYQWHEYFLSGGIEIPLREIRQSFGKNTISYFYENLVFTPQRKFSFFEPAIISFGLPLGVNALSLHFRDLDTWKFIPLWGFQSQISYQFRRWNFFVETHHFRFFKKYHVFLDNQLKLETQPTSCLAMGISQNW